MNAVSARASSAPTSGSTPCVMQSWKCSHSRLYSFCVRGGHTFSPVRPGQVSQPQVVRRAAVLALGGRPARLHALHPYRGGGGEEERLGKVIVTRRPGPVAGQVFLERRARREMSMRA